MPSPGPASYSTDARSYSSSPLSTPSPTPSSSSLLAASRISHLELDPPASSHTSSLPSAAGQQPLSPTHLLRSSPGSAMLSPSAAEASAERAPRRSTGGSSAGAGDDSALDLLVDAHDGQGDHSRASNASDASHSHAQEHSGSHPHSHISRRDASVGLDPDVDVDHFATHRPLLDVAPGTSASVAGSAAGSVAGGGGGARSSSPGSASGRSHHHHHHHLNHGASTTAHESGMPDTAATASATGMPQLFHRAPHGSQKPSRRRSSSRSSFSSASSGGSGASQPGAPQSGFLTPAAFAPGLALRRRVALLISAVAINVGLPFINGAMLGFGEIFARAVLAPWVGFAAHAVGVGAPRKPEEKRGEEAFRSGLKVGTPGGNGLRTNGAWAKGAEGVELEGWSVQSK